MARIGGAVQTSAGSPSDRPHKAKLDPFNNDTHEYSRWHVPRFDDLEDWEQSQPSERTTDGVRPNNSGVVDSIHRHARRPTSEATEPAQAADRRIRDTSDTDSFITKWRILTGGGPGVEPLFPWVRR